jgi:hypothetical protein
VMTVVRFEAVANAAQTQAGNSQPEESPRGVAGFGGLGGRLGRRIINRGNDDKPAAAAAATNRATVMTMQHDILKVSPTVTDMDVAIPAGFKLKS